MGDGSDWAHLAVSQFRGKLCRNCHLWLVLIDPLLADRFLASFGNSFGRCVFASRCHEIGPGGYSCLSDSLPVTGFRTLEQRQRILVFVLTFLKDAL